jgi:NO-binding membrane sensor protein with MHYT domain
VVELLFSVFLDLVLSTARKKRKRKKTLLVAKKMKYMKMVISISVLHYFSLFPVQFSFNVSFSMD